MNKPIDQIIVSLARMIKDNTVVATGVASPIPMYAILLAKKTKKINYLNCTGAFNPEITELPLSSVSINVLEKKERSITLPEIWDYALKGKVELMFFSATQIDKNGNLNITCIGDYNKPKVKLPGPAGSVSLRNLCKKCVVITLNHSKRVFVEKVDFITSGSKKDTTVISNLGVIRLGESQKILSIHAHSSYEEIIKNTGFDLIRENEDIITEIPTKKELQYLNEIDPRGLRYTFLNK